MDGTETASVTGMKPGLRVMISAGGAGIGRAMTETFAAHGAHIHICDISKDALDACLAAVPSAAGMVADVSKEEDVERWFQAAQEHLGGLDVMINNAGIAGPTGAVEDLDQDDWRQTFDVNVHGMYYAVRRAVPLLKQTTDGVMINLSSMAGRLGFPYRTPYAASKWAVIGLTKSLAIELGRYGIRVNAICPGPVAGERIDRVINAKAKELGLTYDELKEQWLELVSLGRMVTAQDIANTALYLASPLAYNVSGQALQVCGDTRALK
ncbi:MAG: 3-oxoacyl-[acyl-carrier-protein] reductase [Rhodospirillaceae bacterium]|nr:3-oxoacyl-[acyl-carrier-protein] reductase [Rhodospirillaceae bacterium]